MKTRSMVLSLAAVALLLGGCATARQAQSSTPERITLKTFGAPGQQFSGVLTVDGVRQDIAGVTPAEYQMECVELSGIVTNASSSKRFGFEVSRKDSQLFTPGTDRVCCFRYHAGVLEVLTAP
jgi:hypothetical protein